MSPSSPDGAVTQLFSRWRAGDQEASEQLLSQVYEELRRVASRYLGRERAGHTLQPTELVNEAFLRLMGSDVSAGDRAHFFSLAARSMRRILVDHERRARAGKRFSPSDRVTLITGLTPSDPEPEVLGLHRALERFAEIAPRPAQMVELRYFGGLTHQEIAEVLDVSLATVERDWKTARIWLHRELHR